MGKIKSRKCDDCKLVFDLIHLVKITFEDNSVAHLCRSCSRRFADARAKARKS